jgi:hypothetical protein
LRAFLDIRKMGIFALNPGKVYSSGKYSSRVQHQRYLKMGFFNLSHSSKKLEMVHFEGICKYTQLVHCPEAEEERIRPDRRQQQRGKV